MDLRNRCVLVTGGAHRVGKAIALHLAKMGAKQWYLPTILPKKQRKSTQLELRNSVRK